jgi:YegS/Rv2252/BmrU family lipid kinase
LTQSQESGTAQAVVVVSVNPRSGSGRGGEAVNVLVRRLQAAGLQVFQSMDVDEVVREAAKWNAAGELRAVVAAGGDGTVGLLANRLPPDTPLAILPLGTENLLAKYLEIEPGGQATADCLLAKQQVALDVGQANGRIFLIMASIGFDAEVVHRMHRTRTGNIKRSSYFRPIWEAISQYRYPQLRILVDGEPMQPAPTWAFVFNVPRYALNLQIVPEAKADDGLLDLRTFRRGNLFHGLKYLSSVVLRLHRWLQDAAYRQARKIEIDSDEPVPIQLDGDPAGNTPVTIEVIPQRLRVFAPPSYFAKTKAKKPVSSERA